MRPQRTTAETKCFLQSKEYSCASGTKRNASFLHFKGLIHLSVLVLNKPERQVAVELSSKLELAT